MAFQFQSSSPPGFITLNPANKKTDQTLSTPLDMEQLIYHTRIALVDTIASLQDSAWGMIPIAEMHELLTKINDILDNAVCKSYFSLPF